jgi:hypothetical protein
MTSVIKSYIQFSKEIPGFSQMTKKDFENMIKKCIYVYMILKNSILYIDNEYYLRLANGVQYTKKWKMQVVGENLLNKMFKFANCLNGLKMTVKELSLLFPFVMTKPCKLNCSVQVLFHVSSNL